MTEKKYVSNGKRIYVKLHICFSIEINQENLLKAFLYTKIILFCLVFSKCFVFLKNKSLNWKLRHNFNPSRKQILERRKIHQRQLLLWSCQLSVLAFCIYIFSLSRSATLTRTWPNFWSIYKGVPFAEGGYDDDYSFVFFHFVQVQKNHFLLKTENVFFLPFCFSKWQHPPTSLRALSKPICSFSSLSSKLKCWIDCFCVVVSNLSKNSPAHYESQTYSDRICTL